MGQGYGGLLRVDTAFATGFVVEVCISILLSARAMRLSPKSINDDGCRQASIVRSSDKRMLKFINAEQPFGFGSSFKAPTHACSLQLSLG
jgi:hypothetical protein